MKDFKIVYLMNALLRSVAFICITSAAINFNNYGLLWWYIVPLLMGVGYSDNDKESKE